MSLKLLSDMLQESTQILTGYSSFLWRICRGRIHASEVAALISELSINTVFSPRELIHRLEAMDEGDDLPRFIRQIKDSWFHRLNNTSYSWLSANLDKNDNQGCLGLIEIVSCLDPQQQYTIISESLSLRTATFFSTVERLNPIFDLVAGLSIGQRASILGKHSINKNNLLTDYILETKPEIVRGLIRLLAELPLEEQVWILTYVNEHKGTVLNYALGKQPPDLVFALLDLIEQLAPEHREKILLTISEKENSLFTLAIEHCPAALSRLFKLIATTLDLNKQALILEHVNGDGNNLLRLAIQKGPELLVQVLELIEPYKQSVKLRLLYYMAPGRGVSNLFHLAIQEHPNTVLSLLHFISHLTLDAQASFTILNPVSYNFLCGAEAKVFDLFLKLITGFKEEQRVEFLGCPFTLGLTVSPLMRSLVAKNDGKFHALLQMVLNLSGKKDRRRILFQTHRYEGTILTCAINHYPAMVTTLLEVLEKELGCEGLLRLIKQEPDAGFNEGKNALFVAVYAANIKALPPILAFIKRLSEAEQFKLLSYVKKNSIENVVTYASLYSSEEGIHLLFEFLEGWTDKSKVSHLLQNSGRTSDDENSGLMNSVARHETIEPWITLLGKLASEERERIFLAKTKRGNILMQAARRSHRKPQSLFSDFLKKFNETQRETLLSETDNEGNNALILAVKYQPKWVKPILQMIDELSSPQRRIHIIWHLNNELETALICAKRSKNSRVEELITEAMDLSITLPFQSIQPKTMGMSSSSGMTFFQTAVSEEKEGGQLILDSSSKLGSSALVSSYAPGGGPSS